MRKIAEIAKALAHPTRLAIIEQLLTGKPTCVSNIEEILNKKQANVSQHLTVLKNANIIDYEEKGKKRCYYIVEQKCISNIFKCLKKLAGK